jgi:hypothetical protein
MIWYTVVNVWLDRTTLGERVRKFLFFVAVVCGGGIMPLLGYWPPLLRHIQILLLNVRM